MKLRFYKHVVNVVALVAACSLTFELRAKTAQAIYEDPFDQAAGGAALTRASQEAVLIANPALMPYGQKVWRWVGTQYGLIAGKDSVDQVRSLSGQGGSSETSSTGDYVDKVFDNPLHFGLLGTLGLITSHLGLAVINRFEADIAGYRHDETGLPEVRARASVYSGAVVGGGYALAPWFSLGLSMKYIYKTEPDVTLSISDQEKIQQLQEDPRTLQKEGTPGYGLGYDVGALLFLQGSSIDWRLAFKVDDIGDTSFSADQKPFKQMVHAGLGLTLHNSIDSIHLAVDVRDLTTQSEDTLVMRTHIGGKLILRNLVGVAAGLYQGYPSFGVRLDLLIVKLGVTYFEREMGTYAGDDGRELYLAYFGVGI